MMKQNDIQHGWKNRQHLIVSIFVLLLLGTVAVPAQKMYWTDERGIHTADFDGENRETLLPVTLAFPNRIAIDPDEGKIYWTDVRTKKIQRASLDGSNVEDLITTGLDAPDRIALDGAERKIYWNDSGTRKIQRANYDGSNVEDIITMMLAVDIALDVAVRKIYWIAQTFEPDRSLRLKIQRANIDGTDIEDFGGIETTEFRNVQVMTLDPAEGKVYWVDRLDKKIRRANLDVTDVEGLGGVEFGDVVPRFTIDTAEEKIYWVASNGQVHRANRDGTDVEDFVTFLAASILEVIDGKVYWVASGRIYRANLDRTDVEAVITSRLVSPMGIALDRDAGKLYWTSGAGKIHRANLNGSDVEDLVTTDLRSPQGIALDRINRKVYWTDIVTSIIGRANLDGTVVEGFTIGGGPRDIVVDNVSSMIYWTDFVSGKSTVQTLMGPMLRNLSQDCFGLTVSLSMRSAERCTGRATRKNSFNLQPSIGQISMAPMWKYLRTPARDLPLS